ncbi:MAG: hypothetical protein ABR531_01315, partial [Bacteroidales bacterium]
MQFSQRYNNALIGVISGILMPVIAFFVFFLLTRHGLALDLFIRRMIEVDRVTEVMSISVFANIVIFLLFNRFDMLRASKGVLGITIAWA